MSLFLKELKFNRKSIIIWSICIVLLLFIAITKEFAMMEAGSNSMNEIMANFPKVARVLFGMNDYDLSTASGYFAMMSTYVFIIVGIHASLLGSGILSKEEIDKTSEFLMTKPISRKKIITAKFLAVVTNLVILNITTLIASIISVKDVSPIDINGEIAYLMLGMFVLQLIFASIGLCVSSITKKVKSAGAISSGILLITWFLAKFVELNENIDFLKYITPFRYFDSYFVFYSDGFEPIYFIISFAIIIASLCIAYTRYNKRDLNI